MKKEIFLFNREVFTKETYDEAMNLMRELIEKSQKEKGAIIYDMYEDISKEYSICVFEKWESREDLENHWKTEHFNRIVPALGKLAKEQTEVYKFEKLD